MQCITSYCKHIRYLRDFLYCVNVSMCRPIYASVIVSDELELFRIGYNVLTSVKWPCTVMSFEHHGVSNQWQFDCLFNNLVRLTSKTTSKFSVFVSKIYSAVPSQRVNNAVLGWRHISIMSNHRRFNYQFNSLSRLITKDTSKLCISGSLWGESGDRWIPLG